MDAGQDHCDCFRAADVASNHSVLLKSLDANGVREFDGGYGCQDLAQPIVGLASRLEWLLGWNMVVELPERSCEKGFDRFGHLVIDRLGICGHRCVHETSVVLRHSTVWSKRRTLLLQELLVSHFEAKPSRWR